MPSPPAPPFCPNATWWPIWAADSQSSKWGIMRLCPSSVIVLKCLSNHFCSFTPGIVQEPHCGAGPCKVLPGTRYDVLSPSPCPGTRRPPRLSPGGAHPQTCSAPLSGPPCRALGILLVQPACTGQFLLGDWGSAAPYTCVLYEDSFNELRAKDNPGTRVPCAALNDVLRAHGDGAGILRNALVVSPRNEEARQSVAFCD